MNETASGNDSLSDPDMSVLIWDFDNTIGERDGGWSSAVLDALDATGIEHRESIETVKPHLRSGFPWHTPDVVRQPRTHHEWWQELNENVFLPYFSQVEQIREDLAHELALKMDQHYLRPDRWRLLGGALDSLEWAHQNGYTNVLLTNNAAGIETILECLNVHAMFEMVVNSANTGVEKPHPQAWNPILERYGRQQVLFMIGDSLTADIAGANAVGIKSILIGKNSDEATICLQSVSQIPQTITQFAGRD